VTKIWKVVRDYGKKRYRKALFGIDYAFPVCTDTDVDSVFLSTTQNQEPNGAALL